MNVYTRTQAFKNAMIASIVFMIGIFVLYHAILQYLLVAHLGMMFLEALAVFLVFSLWVLYRKDIQFINEIKKKAEEYENQVREQSKMFNNEPDEFLKHLNKTIKEFAVMEQAKITVDSIYKILEDEPSNPEALNPIRVLLNDWKVLDNIE